MIEDNADPAMSTNRVDPEDAREQIESLLDLGQVEAALNALESLMDLMPVALVHDLNDQIERRGGRVLKLKDLPREILTDERRTQIVKEGIADGELAFADAERLTVAQVVDRMLASSPPRRIILLRAALSARLHHWAGCEVLLALHDHALDDLVAHAGFLPDLSVLRNAMDASGIGSIWGTVRWSLVSASDGHLTAVDESPALVPTEPLAELPDVAMLVRRAINEVSEVAGFARSRRLLERRYARLSPLGVLSKRPTALNPLRRDALRPIDRTNPFRLSGSGPHGGRPVPPADPATPVRPGRLVPAAIDPTVKPLALVRFGKRCVVIDGDAQPDGTLWLDALPRRTPRDWPSVTTDQSSASELAQVACAHQLVRFLVLSACARQLGIVRWTRPAIGRVAGDEAIWNKMTKVVVGSADLATPVVRGAANDLALRVVRREDPPSIAGITVVLPDVAHCIREAVQMSLPVGSRRARYVVDGHVADPVTQVRILLLALSVVVEHSASAPTSSDSSWSGPRGSVRVRRRSLRPERLAAAPPVALRLSGLVEMPPELAHCLAAIGFVGEVPSSAA